MSDVLLNTPPPADGANRDPAANVAGWLGDLLDAARGRDDAPLARLIAGVMDDLRKAGGGG